MAKRTPSKLTGEQLNQLREAFAVYDVNRDGKVTTRELGMVMRQLGQNPTEADLLAMIKDSSETIRFDDFALFMADKLEKVDTKEELLEAFRAFDVNGSGVISSHEFRHMLTHHGEPLTDDEADELIRVADTGSGTINYYDFVNEMIPK